MILNGRITIYGEFLMHDDAFGLIEKTKLFLSNEKSMNNKHPYYKTENDKTFKYIKKQKLPINYNIKGNLPLGYGFASSSILSFLHLSNTDNVELVNHIDSKIHGFKPSGLDSSYCKRNQGGLFAKGKWLNCNYPKQEWDCILLPKESNIKLLEVQKRILRNKNKLLCLTEEMNKSIKENKFPKSHLFDYATELFSANVYSQQASRIIEYLLGKNIIAKCIGGLYDKAIILNVNEVSSEDIELVKSQINKIKSSQYLDRIEF